MIFPFISPIYFCNNNQNIPEAILSKYRFCLVFPTVFMYFFFSVSNPSND